LKGRLAASDTTWKVIVSSVPMSIPTGFPPTNGRDGWANFDQQTGFERELLDIVRFMADRGMNDTVWITTDVHFAEAFRYRPFADRPSFVVHELATGPLNAGIFPNLAFDTTLSPERLFFFGPATPEAVTSWAEAKRWFNFGTLEVTEDGTLTAGIVDTAGETEFSLELEPSQAGDRHLRCQSPPVTLQAMPRAMRRRFAYASMSTAPSRTRPVITNFVPEASPSRSMPFWMDAITRAP
jgi:alkaline phosphatase D